MINLQKQLLQHQEYFKKTGGIPLPQRVEYLKKLRQAIQIFEPQIEDALKKDLGKPAMEAFTTEIGFLYMSIRHTLAHLNKWARVKKVKSELAQLPGRSYIYPSPYGVALIIGPFNYPVQLLIEPLIAALAGGNVALLKPSELTPHVEKVMKKLIESTFPPEYVTVATGGPEVSIALLELPFDYIFFTGSVRVGKLVMEKASHRLTPLTLELGGKSPVIIEKTANLRHAARRIAWGKFMNAGQTCVAPDYILVEESVYEPFLNELKKAIQAFYGENPQNSSDFGRMVTQRHAERMAGFIQSHQEKVIHGGTFDIKDKYIAPTVFKDISLVDSLMEDELFGSLLPTASFTQLSQIEEWLAAHPKPLAFYVFSENKRWAEQLLRKLTFGGGCLNDTISHVASFNLPFGGVGPSGMGRYHGEAGFKTFTYEKAIVKRPSKVPVNLLFPPYKGKVKWLKKLIK